MRIGIFGGTFDPVHLAHLILAEQCREQAQLEQVWFVLAGRPPHKNYQSLTPFGQRAEMLQLALAGHPAFRVEELEKERPGPTFTADTLAELHRRSPEHEYFLMVGGDALRDLAGWYRPAEIVARASLLVTARPGIRPIMAPELESMLGTTVRFQIMEVPLVDISSTDLRERVRQGRSIRYMVPRAVEAYIQDKHLYHEGGTAKPAKGPEGAKQDSPGQRPGFNGPRKV